MYARHGDLIFRPTTEDKLKQRYGNAYHAKDFTLAIGEATGHAHRLHGEADIFGQGFASAVALKEPTELTHEEHGTITLDPGAYEITREQEFSQDTEQAYAVSD